MVKTNGKMNKVAAYSCIIGDKDMWRGHFNINKHIDHYLFTDKPDIYNDNRFNIIKINYKWFEDINDAMGSIFGKSKRKKVFSHLRAQKYRMLPHQVKELKDYEYTIWFDGSMMIVGDLLPLIDHVNSNTPFGIFRHPHRECLYDEFDFWGTINKGYPEIHNEYIRRLIYEHFPAKYGLWGGGTQIRKHPECNEMLEKTWEHILRYSFADQTSFPYIFWRYGYPVVSIGTQQDKIFRKYLRIHGHKW